ncbi:MAG: glycosyltransferase family 2 protein [Lachnospiraceae bacterium]|nr:glycosyltransferase family 2 protein [Lachnospiraceae bacterium]
MIVKDEEAVLERCLDSVADLMDEIIIVDTGSSDSTKEIASRYTDKIYDYEWKKDFADARNFAFSKATGDYIYSCDADEVLEEQGREEFKKLKQVLMPEIEIVQMKYYEPKMQSVLNAKREYRPKLFKRLRTFTWINPVHETVRLDPVVFDSDIVVTHLPQELHINRDFAIFEEVFNEHGYFTPELCTMYIRELYKCGDEEQIEKGSSMLEKILKQDNFDNELKMDIYCLLARNARIKKDKDLLLAYTTKMLSMYTCAEICYELGEFFLSQQNAGEAEIWFSNALSSECRVDVHTGGDFALEGLIKTYELMLEKPGLSDSIIKFYRDKVDYCRAKKEAWQMPEE